MIGKECRDGINIRVSAFAMMIVLTCAGMGLPSLEEDQKALALQGAKVLFVHDLFLS